MGRPLAENELVERAKGGDTYAYAALVRGHEEIAFRTAVLITGDAAEAEEAAQDGFVKAYRALRKRSSARYAFRKASWAASSASAASPVIRTAVRNAISWWPRTSDA